MAEMELALLPPRETALDVYVTPKGLDPYLAQIQDEITSFEPDTSTRKGREAIASMAYKVSRAKTALDDLGKELVAELKKKPALVDAERKRMRDLLDKWRDEVRAPLTAWEAAEEARIAGHRARIAEISDAGKELGSLDAATLRGRLADLEAVVVDEAFDEFTAEAATTVGKTISAVRIALAAREKHEADQAELARLRAEAEERAKLDREEQIAREAAEAARREAEAKAQAERDAAARREAEAKEAVARAEREREEAEARRVDAERLAEAERLAAEQRARDAAEAARQAEIQRQKDEQTRIAAEQERRERDRAHRAAIHRAAMQAFIAGGVPEGFARTAITLIARGEIPAIRITY